MTTSQGHDDWIEAILEAEKECPWVGPRPYTSNDSAPLVGRDEIRKSFRQRVADNRVILLRGVSGVGKTSLLEAALRPTLERSGRLVIVCDRWDRGEGQDETATDFLARLVRSPELERLVSDKAGEPVTLPQGGLLFWKLDQLFGEEVVLILDQFEELIRYDPIRAENVQDAVAELISAYKCTIVFSFRSEFQHEMERFERKVGPFLLHNFPLEPVETQDALTLITEGEKAAGREPGSVISEDAAKLLSMLYAAAQKRRVMASGDPFERIGLLHLQGALYALYFSAKREQRPIEPRHVKKLLDWRKWTEEPDTEARAFFRGALILSISTKLELAFSVVDAAPDLDPWMIANVKRHLVSIVPHLTAAGYKLVRAAGELLQAAGPTEVDSWLIALNARGIDREAGRAVLTGVLHSLLDHVQPGRRNGVDLVSSSTGELADLIARLGVIDLNIVEAVRRSDESSEDDRQVTTGPMLGRSVMALIVEELRCFVLALSTLQTLRLVRLARPTMNESTLQLIHDGFGTALERWASTLAHQPSIELARFTAARGADYFWKTGEQLSEAPAALNGTVDEPVVYANLRVRGGWVQANFRHTLFVNCDFRGTGFAGCSFEGVTFINCQLDGAMLTDCVVRGAARRYEDHWTEELPTFSVVEAEQELLDALHRYGQDGRRGDVLFTGRPGIPATAGALDEANETYTREPGGLVFYGGRVSTFVMRNNAVEDGSLIAFRDVAGSGLEIVERGGGHYEFHGCALRHVTVTDDGDPMTGKPYFITSEGSSLIQVWIGHRVSGEWQAHDCELIQAHGGAGAFDFSLTGPSTYSDLHGVRVVRGEHPTGRATDDSAAQSACQDCDGDVEPRELQALGELGMLDESLVVRFAAAMDYLRDPSQATGHLKPRGAPDD